MVAPVPYAAIDDEPEPVVLEGPIVDPVPYAEIEDDPEPIFEPDDVVAPPAPPLPEVSSHPAKLATLTARPSETATAARRTPRPSTLVRAPAIGAPQCGQVSSAART